MNKIFTREVVRDYSLIIEEAWFYGLTVPCDKYFGKNPFSPINVFNLKDGVIELWHEENAYKWLIDQIVETSKNNPKLIWKIISDYETAIVSHKADWKRGACKTNEELVKYIQSVFEDMVGFVVFYYLGVDDRTPKEIRDYVLKIRENDKFFEEGDRLIRESLNLLYPKTLGLESGVVFGEVENGKIPSESELKKRRENCVLVPGIFFKNISLKEFEKEHSDFEFLSDSNKDKIFNELKGSIAYMGKIRGVVKIVKRKDQMDKVNEGDILVAPMTIPEFLPAMKKAAAFVTNEGGITSHAAIIARELKKPCIVGTKLATHYLRDGDLVEVDANKGIVKKLN